MTSQMENELLTRVGPGTPMGALMRQYWVPACLSSELKADGDPLRVMLLGERLIAFFSAFCIPARSRSTTLIPIT
jgi:phthalate 4,5-dioxygenase